MEALRALIDAGACIKELRSINAELSRVKEDLKNVRNTQRNPFAVKESYGRANALCQVLNLQKSLLLSLLMKVLPDLRSIELGTEADEEDYIKAFEAAILGDGATSSEKRHQARH